MKFKFGNFSVEMPNKEFLKNNCRMENPFENMFPKANQEMFNDFFKMNRSCFSNYFEEYKKWLEKYTFL